jgi:hypothetical protein
MEIKKCIVCLKEFTRRTKNHGCTGSTSTAKRPSRSVTCGKSCSRIYRRIQEYAIWRHIQNQNKMIKIKSLKRRSQKTQ